MSGDEKILVGVWSPERGFTPAFSVRADVLDKAKQAVCTDRAATHGSVERTFDALAAIWSVRLEVKVTAAQVAILLVDLKTVRAWGNPGHADNWVDIAGYAACGGEVAALAELNALSAEGVGE